MTCEQHNAAAKIVARVSGYIGKVGWEMDDEEQPAAAPNAFDVLMSGPQAKKQKVDPLVFAVIYIRWLRHVSESEPLRGCPYIGQSVRAGYKSAGELAAQRWREENRQAVR
jgi:hypothetical protein